MTMTKGISTLVCLVCFLVGSALTQSRPTAPITVTVTTTSHGYAIPLDFSGLAFSVQNVRPGQYRVRGYLFDPTTNPEVLTLFQNLGIRNLRIGSSGGVHPQPAPAFADIDELFSFAAADNLKIIFSSDLLNGNEVSDATNAAYILDHYRANLYSFALDNETDFHSAHTYCTKSGCTCVYPTGCTGTSFNLHIDDPSVYETAPIGSSSTAGTAFSSYLAKWRKFANSIVSSAPGAIFSGPDTGAYSKLTYTPNESSGISWTQALAEAEKGAVNGNGSPLFKAALQHYYVGGNLGTTTVQQAIDNMLSSDWVDGTAIATQPSGAGDGKTTTYTPYPWLYTNNLAPELALGVPYRITESNAYLGGRAGASNSYASALWALDYMQWWAQHGAEGVNFENNPWILTDTIVPDPNPTPFLCQICGNWQTAPKGYGIKAFDLGGHGYVEPIEISNSNNLNITAYAVGEAQDLYVTIVNKTHSTTNDSTDAVVSIQPKGFTAASCASMVLTDGDPGNAGLMTATLGGATIANNARWEGTWTPLAPDLQGSCTATVQATTAAVLKIHAASNYAGPIQINQNGALEVFGTGMNGDNWYDSQIAADVPNSPLSNWNGWVDQQGGIQSKGGPAVVKNLDNTLEVFIPGTTGDVYYSYQLIPGGKWSSWIDMGSSSAGMTDLHAANNADGSLSVFGIGNNGDVWFASQNAPGVGWSNWTDLSGEQIQPGFVVGQNLNGLLEIFGVDDNGNVWDNGQTASGGWNGWSALRGDQTNSGAPGDGWHRNDNGEDFREVERINPRLAVARNLDGRLELFGIGPDLHVWYISQQTPGGMWDEWRDLSGVNIGPGFVVGQQADGRLAVFGVWTRGQGGWNNASGFCKNHHGGDVWSISQQTPGGRWGHWQDLGGGNIDPQLVVGNTADGRIQLFGTGQNQDVWSDWQQNAGGSWAGWSDFGGEGIQMYGCPRKES